MFQHRERNYYRIFWWTTLSLAFLIGTVQAAAQSPPAFAQLNDGATCAAELDLGGAWQFRQAGEAKWLPAQVPGSVYSDLLHAGRIEDPYYRDNEVKVQQIGDKDWEYRRTFLVDPAFLRHDRIILDCRGLDTIAEVTFNDAKVGDTKNMFVEYAFDVKPLLKSGENTLHILFHSAVKWSKQMDESDPRVVWRNIFAQRKGYTAFLRKEACDFGWDWSIRLVRCGIWRPIRLVAYDTARIAYLDVRQDLSDPNRVVLHVATDLERYADMPLSLDVSVKYDDAEVARGAIPIVTTGDTASVDLMIENPRLWWPNGWGDQPIYTVTATLTSGGREVHRRSVRIGLRTFELVREKDERGETFGFKVNGHLIFCKGANWVPADAIPERLTVEDYRHLLQSCADAHFNMLRMWGGGRYEPDCFYDLCDELGILLWHDFMFAEGPYVPTPEYLANVRDEVRSMVRRLKHHPSIALWCGNNESESGMSRGHHWLQYETVTWDSYDEVFYKAIPETQAKYDPDRPYWPSSPHNPVDRAGETPEYRTSGGDAHYWDVWHHLTPFSAFDKMQDYRFVSEFGHQSFPTMATIQSFTLPEDRNLTSHVLELHQKCHGKGCQRIAYYIGQHFLMPVAFEDWVYLSQVVHGLSMKIGSEAFRRNFPHTTGTLYWQLNDNWPTFSGSSLDYYGRWKACHYMARHFFNPILVSGVVDETRVTLWGVNDYLEPQDLTLRWSLQHVNGNRIREGSRRVVLPANSSTMIAELDFQNEAGEGLFYKTERKESFQNRRNFYLAYELVRGDKQVVSTNLSFFAPPKYMPLENPEIRRRIEKTDNGIDVTLTAEKFAPYVELGVKDSYARFSDNYFHLVPGVGKRVEVIEADIPTKQVKKRLYIKSVVDTYQLPE